MNALLGWVRRPSGHTAARALLVLVLSFLVLVGSVSVVWWVAIQVARFIVGEQCFWIAGVGGCQ